MELLGVGDVAEHLGVSPRRVRAMLADGLIKGRQVGGRWMVDPSSLASVPRAAGQPLSLRSAWGLIAIANGAPPANLSASEVSRLRRRWRQLVADDVPLPRLRALLARRAHRRVYSAPDAAGLRADSRVSLSGRSDPRSGMADSRLAEGYVAADDLEDLTFDHLLVEAEVGEEANAVLYAAPDRPDAPVPWLLVAADLADGGPREAQQAANLISEVLQR